MLCRGIQLVGALLVGFHLAAQQPLVPRADLRALERASLGLARAGSYEEWQELLGLLGQLGTPPRELAQLRANGAKVLARGLQDGLAEPLAAVVGALPPLAARLAKLTVPSEREALAQLLRKVDAAHEAANRALGYELVGRQWLAPGEAPRLARRAALAEALRAAHRLEVPIASGMSRGDEADALATGSGLLREVLGRPVTWVRAGQTIVHSARSPLQTERIVREAMRAAAFAAFTADEALQPPLATNTRVLMLDDRRDYRALIERAEQRGLLSEEEAGRAVQLGGFYLRNGVFVDLAILETEAQAALLVALEEGRLPAAVLSAGHLNWVCRACLGTSLPSYTFDAVWVEALGAATASHGSRAAKRREQTMLLAEAGLVGSRTFLSYLAERRQDPPWQAGMLSQLGEVQGKDLLKATFVAEFLIEEGRLAAVANAFRGTQPRLSQPAGFAIALGEPLAVFEARWRTWLVDRTDGIVQRLRIRLAEQTGGHREGLTALNELRERAFTAASASLDRWRPVTHDSGLGAGCGAHARYLAQHPERSEVWPDLHEQDPRHEDWSIEGAWAGQHSVIATRTRGQEAALQAWMATFYHRLPLLDPGLLRVGLGRSGGIVVLDAESMRAPSDVSWHVAWPPDGMTSVPTRFVPELPNPVPGVEMSELGYPITLQLGARADGAAAAVRMELFDGATAVPCWFTSPQAPRNPQQVPGNCYGLIPKQPLRAGTTYSVQAVLGGNEVLRWQFRT